MKRFQKRFKDRIAGIVAGPDRLLFRGTLRSISHIEGLEKFLSASGILYKDFGRFTQSVTGELCQAAESWAQRQGRPYEYLQSAKRSKEEYALAVARQNGIEEGLICVLACTERCQSFRIRKNREKKKLEVVPHRGQCKHLYFYFLDREFGLMHVRLQTWIPFTIQVCLNGREWLGRQMRARGIKHQQQDNCFTQIADVEEAQELMDRLPLRRWVARFNAWARRANPWLRSEQGQRLKPYYWSTRESEYATDVIFRPGELQKIYPLMVRHAIDQFGCCNVLRFLGKRRPAQCRSEVRSHWGEGPDGVRVKHWVEENSIKMYDKKGSVLRVETTINNSRCFNVRRRNKTGQWVWMRLRKGVADFRRSMRICHAANGRYLNALAAVTEPQPSCRVLDVVSQPAWRGKRRYRALRPVTPDEARRLQALADEETLLEGVRNRDLRHLWGAPSADPLQRRALAARVSRWLAMVVTHGLLYRIRGTNRYRLTGTGHQMIAAVRAARQADLAQRAA